MTSFADLKLAPAIAPTGLLPREGDGYFQGKVHVTSVILTIALITEVGSKLSDNSTHADQAALIFSLLLLLCGIIAVVSVSVSSTKPFSQHGIVHALAIWAFVGAFTCLIYSFVGTHATVAGDHNARVLGLFCGMFQSLGISTLMAAFITGVAASNAPYDDRITTA